MAVRRRFRSRLRWPRARRRSGVEPAYDRLVRLWLPIAQPGGPPTRRTLRALLAPEAGCTRFEGRDGERGDLLRWCTEEDGPPVQVLVGPAGVGKTRLAVEVARALPEGWAAGVARPGTAAQIVPVAADCKRPVLIVVDDADTEPAADIATLLDHAADAPDQVRVLVVARTADALDARECAPLRAEGTDDDRRRVFADAVRAFAGLGADAVSPPWAERGCGPVGADGEPIGTTLVRAALAADDRERGPALRTADLDRLTAALLEGEKRRWAATAADPRWSFEGLAPDAQEEALLALLLQRPRRIDDAVAALRTLDRFRLATEEHVHDVATWAGHLYPGPVGGRWLDPQPEPVRCALYAAAFDRHRSLLMAALDRDAAAFLPIARAAAGHPPLAAALDALLGTIPLNATLEAAVGAGPPGLVLRDHLVAALAVCAPAAVDVERLIPRVDAPIWAPLRIALRRADIRHRRLTADDPVDAGDFNDTARDGRGALAVALTALGAAHASLGEHREALAPRREAVQIHRDLDAEPELAAALTDLGASLRSLGEHDSALATTREAVRRYRNLVAAGPDRHGGDLARALIDLAADLRSTGAHEDALEASREAVRRCRDVAAADPARHLPDLADALTGLGADLRACGAHRDALETSREAVRLYRDVVANAVGRRGPDLARALTDLGADLLTDGEHDEAVVACREAVRRFAELAATGTGTGDHLPDLARAHSVLGAALRESGDYQAGIAACRDAVRLYRELAAADPDRHTPDLARALTQLGIGLRASDEGLAVAWEAVQLARQLAAADPDRHAPDLARALAEIGTSLRGLGAQAEALIVTSEAVQMGRDLAAYNPARHVADLARALIGLSAGLRALGRRPEALAHEGEAVAWWWHLTQHRPGEFDEVYREAQRRHFHSFSLYDHDPDDLLTAESIARSRVLAYLAGVQAESAPEDELRTA